MESVAEPTSIVSVEIVVEVPSVALVEAVVEITVVETVKTVVEISSPVSEVLFFTVYNPWNRCVHSFQN